MTVRVTASDMASRPFRVGCGGALGCVKGAQGGTEETVPPRWWPEVMPADAEPEPWVFTLPEAGACPCRSLGRVSRDKRAQLMTEPPSPSA
ncbi:hypothetical protein GCM10027162_35990 [Streptomyces incanus]